MEGVCFPFPVFFFFVHLLLLWVLLYCIFDPATSDLQIPPPGPLPLGGLGSIRSDFEKNS